MSDMLIKTGTSIISCQNILKSYGSKKVLNDISFELEAGAPIALVGPNGAGKTTLMSLICGFMQPSSGEISMLGHKPGSQTLAGVFSALPQDALFDPGFSIGYQLTLLGQLQGLSKSEAKKEAERTLELMDLSNSFKERPTALSHGMRKRASIAQALIGSPKIVLLDEPTAGLDPVNAKNIRQVVQSLSDKVTFLISSHNLLELEKLCHSVLFLDGGKIQYKSSIYQSDHSEGDTAETLLQDGVQQLTVSFTQAVTDQLVSMLNSSKAIESVEQKGRNELVISYHDNDAGTLDLAILGKLREKGWQYRHLIRGLSLEEQLFNN